MITWEEKKNVTNENIKIIKCKIGSNYLYLCKLQVEFLAYYLLAVQGLVGKYHFDSSHDSLIIVIRIYTFYLNIYRQHSLLVILFIPFAFKGNIMFYRNKKVLICICFIFACLLSCAFKLQRNSIVQMSMKLFGKLRLYSYKTLGRWYL